MFNANIKCLYSNIVNILKYDNTFKKRSQLFLEY